MACIATLGSKREGANTKKKGLSSSIPSHKGFQYCLNPLPMFRALLSINVAHLGRAIPGKESKFPRRKERKIISQTILPKSSGRHVAGNAKSIQMAGKNDAPGHELVT